MKKYLLLLVITIGSNLEGRCQVSDTLCFPLPVIRKVLIAASQKKIADSLLTICEHQVSQLQATIKLFGEKDKETVAGYELQIKNLNNQIVIYKDQVKGYEKLLRRERLKRKLVTGAGILTTGAALFLSLKK